MTKVSENKSIDYCFLKRLNQTPKIMNLLLHTGIKTKKVKTHLEVFTFFILFYRIITLCDDLHRQP